MKSKVLIVNIGGLQSGDEGLVFRVLQGDGTDTVKRNKTWRRIFKNIYNLNDKNFLQGIEISLLSSYRMDNLEEVSKSNARLVSRLLLVILKSSFASAPSPETSLYSIWADSWLDAELNCPTMVPLSLFSSIFAVVS